MAGTGARLQESGIDESFFCLPALAVAAGRPLPVPGSYPGKAARHAGWAETALAGACTHLALTQLAERFADYGELEPDPRPGSGAAGG